MIKHRLPWTEHLIDACERHEAGFHFEEGGCFGFALALYESIRTSCDRVRLAGRDDFCHAAVLLDGVAIDHQGICSPESSAKFKAFSSQEEFEAWAQNNGCSEDDLASDMQWAQDIITTARASQPGPWNDESLAVNGKPVGENFRDWFGSSVAVDEAGVPLTLFHGTLKDFDAFAPVDPRTRGGSRGRYFFTESPVHASAYAGTALGHQYNEARQGYDSVFYGEHSGGQVMAVHLSLQNPLVFNAGGQSYDLVEAKAMQIATEGGHDGVIFRDVADSPGAQGSFRAFLGTVYVAFEATQIKSALGNSGLFLKDSACLTDTHAAMALTRSMNARCDIEALQTKQTRNTAP